MGLMERVAALVRANLNDLVEKADDPERVLRQVISDMDNQLLQVKTQVARAVAHEQLLMRQKADADDAAAESVRRAELAVSRGNDDAARRALAQADTCRRTGASIEAQLAAQRSEAETFRRAYKTLEQKLGETSARCDALIAQDRRSRLARGSGAANVPQSILDSLRDRPVGEAFAAAKAALSSRTTDERLDDLDRDDRIEALLRELKQRKRG